MIDDDDCPDSDEADSFQEAYDAACKPTNPKDCAAISRLDLSLVPASATIYTALALTEGHCKYGGYNWRTAGVLASVYVAALMRHLSRWVNGEECDPVTKVPHLASIQACGAILIDATEHGRLINDLPPAQDVASLLDRAQDVVKHLQALYPNGPDRHTQLNNPSDESEEATNDDQE